MVLRCSLSVLIGCAMVARASDTLTIPLITNERFPGQPSEKQAVVHLPTDRSYARLHLWVRLSCPCGRGLGEWDYTVRFFVLRPTAERDSAGNPNSERIEIARFITPYAGNRPTTWSWAWRLDVTDYRILFGDSTTVIVSYQGWTQSALFRVHSLPYGWKLSKVYPPMKCLHSSSSLMAHSNTATPITQLTSTQRENGSGSLRMQRL